MRRTVRPLRRVNESRRRPMRTRRYESTRRLSRRSLREEVYLNTDDPAVYLVVDNNEIERLMDEIAEILVNNGYSIKEKDLCEINKFSDIVGHYGVEFEPNAWINTPDGYEVQIRGWKLEFDEFDEATAKWLRDLDDDELDDLGRCAVLVDSTIDEYTRKEISHLCYLNDVDYLEL